jgi:DNA replication protein DnaC
MPTRQEVIKDLQKRLTTLAGLQGKDCPSCDLIRSKLRDFEYKNLAKWLMKAPAPASAEYVAMREEHIVKAVADALHPIVLPSRHARQNVEHTNKEWSAAFRGISERLAENEDAMFALLGKRGTGKTQLSVELIRHMARCRAEASAMSLENLERWAWLSSGFPVRNGFALYSNTMDFFLRLRKTYQPDSEEKEDDVLQRYISPSLLILDEAHDRRESDWENQMFTYLVDHRYQSANKQTIFIANQSAAEFERSIGASIADRIHECGAIVECNWKSFRTGR